MAEKKFYPFFDQIEIVPMKKETVFEGDGQTLLEAGEVVAVGGGAGFFKVGDIAHFEPFGCSKTTKEIDGIEHYVVVVNSHVIRGKHARE